MDATEVIKLIDRYTTQVSKNPGNSNFLLNELREKVGLKRIPWVGR